MSAPTNSRSARMLVLVTTTVLSVSGCYKWTTLDRPADLAMRDRPVGRAVITDTLGEQIRLTGLRLEEGAFRGFSPEDRAQLSMPVREVRSLRIRESAPKRSLGLGLGVAAGIASIAAMVVVANNFDPLGECFLGCPE